jgi:PadR family transcriptional regulator
MAGSAKSLREQWSARMRHSPAPFRPLQPFPYPGCLFGSTPHTLRGTMAPHRLELVKGTLDVLILKTLSWGPMHGYGVSRWIRQRTEGVLAIEDAALYQALHRLERRKWVQAEWGLSENNRRAKYYRLTTHGRKQLLSEDTVWRTYARAVFQVLEAESA